MSARFLCIIVCAAVTGRCEGLSTSTQEELSQRRAALVRELESLGGRVEKTGVSAPYGEPTPAEISAFPFNVLRGALLVVTGLVAIFVIINHARPSHKLLSSTHLYTRLATRAPDTKLGRSGHSNPTAFGPQKATGVGGLEDQGMSGSEATLTLIASMVGVGAMALAHLQTRGGVHMTLFLLVLGCASTLEAGRVYFSGVTAHNTHYKDKPHMQIETYEDFAFHAIGSWGPSLVQTMRLSWLLGGIVSFYILLVSNLEGMFAGVWGASYDLWCSALVIPLLILCLFRDMGSTAKLMPIVTVAALLSCVGMITTGLMDAKPPGKFTLEKPYGLHVAANFRIVGQIAAYVFGAFGWITTCAPLMDQMNEPKGFMGSLRSALAIIFAAYLGVYFLGLNGYGSYHFGTMEKNSHGSLQGAFKQPPTTTMLSYLFGLVTMYMAAAWAQGMATGSMKNYAMRAAFALGTYVFALRFRDFSTTFCFFSSVCAPLLNMVFPLCFGLQLRAKIKPEPVDSIQILFRGCFHAVIYMLSLFTIGFGGVACMQVLLAAK